MSSIFAQLNAFVQVRVGARVGARVRVKPRVKPPTPTRTPNLSPSLSPKPNPHPTSTFVQRCKDLQEVCEGQTQFARRGESYGEGEDGKTVRSVVTHPLPNPPSPNPSRNPSPNPNPHPNPNPNPKQVTHPLPDFGGSRGPEVSSSLLSIQARYRGD